MFSLMCPFTHLGSIYNVEEWSKYIDFHLFLLISTSGRCGHQMGWPSLQETILVFMIQGAHPCDLLPRLDLMLFYGITPGT